MFSMNRAAKYTQVAPSQTDSEIQSGESITVYGVVIDGGGAGTVIFEEADGSTEIMRVSVVADNESQVLDFIWLADQGLTITTPANVYVTVFHSQSGS